MNSEKKNNWALILVISSWATANILLIISNKFLLSTYNYRYGTLAEFAD